MRRCDSQHIEFPLTLGRDFVGVVAHRGMAVRDDVRVGDRVWGMVPFHRAGCHAEFAAVDANNVMYNFSTLFVFNSSATTVFHSSPPHRATSTTRTPPPPCTPA